MKKILLAFTLITTIISYGQTEKGNWMIGSNLGLSFSSKQVITKQKEVSNRETTTIFDFTPDANYFYINNLSLGIGLDYMLISEKGNYTTSSFGIMPNGKYFFPKEKVAPFLGLGVGYKMTHTSTSDKENIAKGGLTMRAEAGIAYFFTRYFATTINVKYDYFQNESDKNKDNITQTSILSLGIGVAYFL